MSLCGRSSRLPQGASGVRPHGDGGEGAATSARPKPLERQRPGLPGHAEICAKKKAPKYGDKTSSPACRARCYAKRGWQKQYRTSIATFSRVDARRRALNPYTTRSQQNPFPAKPAPQKQWDPVLKK